MAFGGFGRWLSVGARFTFDDQLSPAMGNMSEKVKGAKSSLENMKGPIGKVESMLGGLAKTALKVAAALTGAGLIKDALDTEETFSKLRASGNLTEKQFKSLEKQSYVLGATTNFNTKLIAEAQLELKYGLNDVNQVLAATPGVANLAAAALLEPKRAAEITIQALKGWKLQGKDAAMVADLLAVANKKIGANLEEVSQGMKNSATTLKAFNIDIKQGIAAIATAIKAGAPGSEFGTALTGGLNIFSTKLKPEKKLIKKLGLDVDALNQGNLIGFLQSVAKGVEKLKPTAQTEALSRLFGQEAGSRIKILLGDMPTLIANYQRLGKVNGEALKIATTQSDNLKTQMNLLKGSISTVFTVILLPALKLINPLVQGASNYVNDLVMAFTKVSQGEALTGVSEGFKTFIGYVYQAKEVLSGLWEDVVVLGKQAFDAIMAWDIAAIVKEGVSTIMTYVMKMWEVAKQTFGGFLEGAKEVIETIRPEFVELWEAIKASFENIWNAISKGLGLGGGNIRDFARQFAHAVGVVVFSVTWLVARLAEGVQWITESWVGKILSGIAEVVGGFIKILDGGGNMKTGLIQILKGLGTIISAPFISAFNLLKGMFKTVVGWVADALDTLIMALPAKLIPSGLVKAIAAMQAFAGKEKQPKFSVGGIFDDVRDEYQREQEREEIREKVRSRRRDRQKTKDILAKKIEKELKENKYLRIETATKLVVGNDDLTRQNGKHKKDMQDRGINSALLTYRNLILQSGGEVERLPDDYVHAGK